MTAASVADQICAYFGGTYDPGTHTYRTPQLAVDGVAMGAVRRGKPKRFDKTDYFLGAVGVPIGCQIMVFLSPGDEMRVGFGGSTAGLKRSRHDVEFNVLLYSEAPYAEDVQDAVYAVRDAILAHIRADRTCGSGGFEAGGFQVGEGGPPWIHWHFSEVMTTAESTEALLLAQFAADEYLIA